MGIVPVVPNLIETPSGDPLEVALTDAERRGAFKVGFKQGPMRQPRLQMARSFSGAVEAALWTQRSLSRHGSVWLVSVVSGRAVWLWVRP